MKFQSKFRNHKIIMKPTTRIIYPGQGSSIVPGIRIVFEGPQRIFDSEAAALKYGWSPELREEVEDYVLSNRAYGRGIYLAPGEQLPEHKLPVARVKPENQRRRCLAIQPIDGDLVQCQEEPTVGRDYCAEHDPDQPRIIKGLQTT